MSKKQYYRNITRTIGCTKVIWISKEKNVNEKQVTYVPGKYFLNEVAQLTYFRNKHVLEASVVKCQFKLSLDEFIQYAECIEVE